jgi:small subunit ribosomal protein S11
MSKKEEKNVGIVNVYATFNNTIVSVTDLAGNTIGSISGGQITKHDRMRSNPTIAMFIAKKILEVCRDYRICEVYISMKGQTGAPSMGPGASAIIRTMTKEGMKIINIADTTAIARGGPKKKGGRRGRRP